MDEKEALYTMIVNRLTSIETKLDTLAMSVARMQGASEAKSRMQMVIAGGIGAIIGAVPTVVTFFRGH